MQFLNNTSQAEIANLTRGQMKIEVVEQLAGLDKHIPAWNALAKQAWPKLPTCSATWLITYFEFSLKPNQSWFVIFSYDDTELVGVLPLVVNKKKLAGLPFTLLQTPKDNQTQTVSPLLAAGRESEALQALLTTAWSCYPSALWIEMNDIASNASLLSQTKDYLHCYIFHRTGAYLPCDGDQETYQASLSKNFRSNQRKAENKLRKMTGVEYEFLTGSTASSEQLTEFLPVEASGWKGREGTAIQESAHLIQFYKRLTDRLCKEGWLEWHFLRAEGKTIAANLAIRFNHSVVVWKLGYDESYSRCSPGGILFQRLLDRSFPDPQIQEINLLTEAPWYDNWRMARREYFGLRFYNQQNLRSRILGFFPNRLIYLAKSNKILRALVQAVRSLKSGNRKR